MQTLQWQAVLTVGLQAGGCQPLSRWQSLAVGRGNPEFSPHLPPRLVHLAVKRNSFLGGPRGKGCLSPWACVCSHRGSQKADKPRFGALLCHCQPCSFRQVMALFCAPVSLFAR